MANPYRHYNVGSGVYDDFDPKKNFMKILFRPGYAVQARELTQSQTYLNNQLATLGSYFFKDGTPVDGAKISYTTDQPIVKVSIDDTLVTNLDDYIKDYIIGYTFTTYSGFGDTTIKNSIKVIGHHRDENGADYLLFTYLGDRLSEGGNQTFTRNTDESTPITFTTLSGASTALVAACSEGSVFVDGYFVYVPQSSIIVSPTYDSTDETEYYVGYDITRTEISSAEDSSLNDNAHGSYNYKAPGANRYKLEVTLSSYTKDSVPSVDNNGGFDFISGIVVKGGVLIKEQSYDENTAFMDLLAKRTYEESGSYTVDPWKVQVKESDDENKYKISIGSGTGYIHGYRVSTLVSKELEADKPRTTLYKEGLLTTIPNGLYTYAKYDDNGVLSARGLPDFLKLADVLMLNVSGEVLYTTEDGYYSRVVNDYEVPCEFYEDRNLMVRDDITSNDIIPSNTIVCSITDDGRIYKFNSSSDSKYFNTLNEIDLPEAYINLLKVIPHQENIIQINSINTTLLADKIVSFNKYQSNGNLISSNNNVSLIGTCKIASLRRQGNKLLIYLTDVNRGEFSSARSLVSFNSDTKVLNYIDIQTENEEAVLYGSDLPKIIQTGYTHVDYDTDVGVNKNFNLTFDFISAYEATGVSDDKVDGTSSITFNRYINTTTSAIINNGNDDLIAIYDVETDKHIDLTNLSIDVTSNTIRITSSSKDTFVNGRKYIAYAVYSKLSDSSSMDGYRIKTKKSFTETLKSENGLLVLSKEDIYNISSIYSISEEDTTNYITNVIWNNGQTDYLYDNGFVTGLTDGEYTITYEYFEHSSSVGPFIATSYGKDLYESIPTYRSSLTNVTYNLRDCMDFRIKRSLLNTTKTYYPCHQSDVTYNLSIFLPRIDTVWVDKNGVFGMTHGIPAEYPEVPEEKNDVLTLYHIYADAYGSSIVPKYINNQRHTMSELNKMETRLSKVEDMLSLTMLEQSAVNMQITDEDGYNRFKSGIFTDGFVSYQNSDVEDKEWNASIDAIECSIRPKYVTKNLPFVYFPEKNNNLTYKAPVITLPQTDAVKFVENPYASESFRIQDIEMNTWIGKAVITPSVDVWYDDTLDDSNRAFRDWSLSNKVITNDDSINKRWTKEQKYSAKNVTNTTSYDSSWEVANIYNQMETQSTYLSSKVVTYTLTNMRPNTIIKIFFDGVEIIKDGLVTDSNGFLTGEISIPKYTDVGRKLIEFCDETNSTVAYAEYLSLGRSVWTDKSTYIRDYTSLWNNGVNSIYADSKVSKALKNATAVAQSFSIDGQNGVMLKSVDLFFASSITGLNQDDKDNLLANAPAVQLSIVECENGFPSKTLLPFSVVNKTFGEIYDNISDETSMKPVTFEFDAPVYLSPNIQYAFVVTAPSELYRIYTATIGATDLVSGVGVKEQPYVGTMFVSYNLSNWIAQPITTLKFALTKCVFEQSSSIVFNLNSVDDINNPVDMKVSAQTLALNTFIPNMSDIKYEYKWKELERNQFINKEDIFNSKSQLLNNEGNISEGVIINNDTVKTLNYNNAITITCNLSTTDKNVSPIIDTEQVYGIFSECVTTDVSVEEVNSVYPIQKNNEETNIANTSKMKHCGTYISSPVSLENPADDLRVIIDANIPSESVVKVSFRNSRYIPEYVLQKNTDISTNVNNDSMSFSENIGKRMQVYYYNKIDKQFEAPNLSPDMCIISGYDSSGINPKIYLRSVGNRNVFYDYDSGNTANGGSFVGGFDNSKYNAIYLLPIIEEETIPCAEYEKTKLLYEAGSYVFYNNIIWKAKINCYQGMLPSNYSQAWEKINGASVISAIKLNESDVLWRPMIKDSTKVATNRTTTSETTTATTNVGNSVTTIKNARLVESSSFKEFVYNPAMALDTEFTEFVIRIDLYAYDDVNVPRVKNLRAIAVV